MIKVSLRQLMVLQAVQNGMVKQHFPIGMKDPIYSEMDMGPGTKPRRYMKITATTRALEHADLIWLAPPEQEFHYKASRVWRLTDAGAEVLKQTADAAPDKTPDSVVS